MKPQCWSKTSKKTTTMHSHVYALTLDSCQTLQIFSRFELLIAALECKRDVNCVTKTSENSNISRQYCFLSENTLISNQKKKGGGVALHVKNWLKFNFVKHLAIMQEKVFESIFILIWFHDKEVTVSVVHYADLHIKISCHFSYL